jgi:hypothetical protein
VTLVRIEVAEEFIASIIRVRTFSGLRTTIELTYK